MRQVIGVASARNHALLLQWGADHVLDCTTAWSQACALANTDVQSPPLADKLDVVESVLKLRPGGADVLLDCHGGDFVARAEPVGTHVMQQHLHLGRRS